MSILSLKNVLLCRLEQTLLGAYKEQSASFINFLYDGKVPPYCSPKTALLRAVCWQKISLQKKRKAAGLIYLSALPQIFASHQDCSHPSTVAEISERMVNRLKKTQFQTLNSDSYHERYESILCSKLWAEFEVKTHRPGWIELSLSDQGIEIWIQRIQVCVQKDGLCPPCQLNREYLSFANHRSSKAFTTVDQNHIALKVNKPGQNHPEKPSNNRAKRHSRNVTQSVNHTSTESKLAVPINNQYPQPNSPGNGSHPSLEPLSDRVSIDTDRLRSTASQHQSADARLWQAQYTHARCCSLLRLWQAARPQQIVPQRGHTHIYPSEAQRLIHALIEIADDMFWIPYRWPTQQYFLLLKASVQLCQAFEFFHRTCLNGFSQVSQAANAAPDFYYFQAQFDLVSATKNMLKTLLQEHLEADYPTEL